MPRIGIYAGSFDPFHIGHKSLLEDASHLLDRIIILVAHNESKRTRAFSMSESLGQVAEFIGGRARFEAGMMAYTASPGRLAQELGNTTLIRGIRDITDMDYERRLATFNCELFGVQTLFLFSRPELAHVNGTAIRELIRLGLDHSRYL